MMKLNIPKIYGEQLSLTLEDGDQLFVVGANGSGKSALLQHWISSDGEGKIRHGEGKIRRISAHRQTWFESGGINLTPDDRRRFDIMGGIYERRPDALWKDRHSARKQSAILFDLVEKEHIRTRSIVSHVGRGDAEKAAKVASESPSPFDRVNELLEKGMLDISIRVSSDGEMLASRGNTGQAFSIVQMSDGERNALIVAATVLTVKPGTVLLIDEPERHLHRSIIEPFLSALLECRDDCAFVVSTHEIALPVANPNARVLMLRSCAWEGNGPKAWDVELLEPNDDLPDELKFAVLGARKRILFVEGAKGSLDFSLYSILFPGLSVVSKGGCRDVVEAVKGLRRSDGLHHVEAFGLIDRDDRTPDQVRKLAEGNVFALEVVSVEALYYCSDSIEAVASRQARSFDLDADELIESGKAKAFDSILRDDNIAERMSARKCKSRVRTKILSDLPDCKQIQTAQDSEISVSVDSGYADELSRFKKLVAERKLDDLIARYPLHDGVFDAIAKALKCPGKRDYERMVLSMVRSDQGQGLAWAIRKRIGPLADKLETDPA